MSEQPEAAVAAPNRITLRKLLVVVVIMFGFGYAMVPFYQRICESTGFWNLLQPDKVEPVNTQVDTSRTVRVEFDSNISGLPWNFKPEKGFIEAHPGQVVQIAYDVANTTGREIAGQAIPAYAPQRAAQYFHKLECFCFSKQVLGPNETRRMPVVFVVDPNLPADVHTITLSYTFFEISNGVTAAGKG